MWNSPYFNMLHFHFEAMKFLKKSNLYQHFAKEKFPNQQTRVPFEKK